MNDSEIIHQINLLTDDLDELANLFQLSGRQIRASEIRNFSEKISEMSEELKSGAI